MSAVTKDVAMKVWQYRYGNATEVLDPFRKKIVKDDFNGKSETSWTVEHTYPKSRGGLSHFDNLVILETKNAKEKGDLLTGFVNGYEFEIRIMIGHDKKVHRAALDVFFTPRKTSLEEQNRKKCGTICSWNVK